MVLGESETYLPHLALYIYLLQRFATVSKLIQLGGPRGKVLSRYGWVENQMVHNELVRILELEHTPIF